MPVDITALGAQYGFPVVMAILIWKAYENSQSRWVSKLIEVITTNSEALQKVAVVIEHATRTTEVLVNKVDSLDERIMRLESCTHSEANGHGACPYVAATRKEG